MDAVDKKLIVERYESRLNKYGFAPQSLGMFKGRQLFRFHFLSQINDFRSQDSVLDVGCGFGDLEPYLRSTGWKGGYCGIDVVPELIREGKEKRPYLDLKLVDLQQEKLQERFDWAFCSGVFNARTIATDPYEHLHSMITIMCELTRKGVAINLLSPHVDYQSDIGFHPEIGHIVRIVASLTRRFTIRHDYMPYEFTVYLYKQQEIYSEANVFQRYLTLYKDLKN